MSNLTDLPGAATLACEKCQSEIKLHTHAQAKSCVCGNCGRLYDVRQGSKLTYRKNVNNKIKPHIPIGVKGILDDVEWTVTGFTVKKEAKYKDTWREYTLFNPVHGYASLTEFDGHWIYALSINAFPAVSKNDVMYNNTSFQLYNKYKSALVSVSGEFPYDVTDDEKFHYEEFINPPEVLCREHSSASVEWYRGWHFDPAEIREAFKIEALPFRQGVGMVQPQSLSLDFETVIRITIVAILGILAIQGIFQMTSLEKKVFTLSGTVNDSTTNKMIVTEPFNLEGGKKNLAFKLHADVSNSWLETWVTLVNENTNETFTFEHGVEYYYGYDGGNWSEGSTTSEKILEAVPEGTYHMLLTPIKNPQTRSTYYDITLVRDVPRWSNFFKALAILAIFPLIQFYRTRNFEKNRWMNSDYSTYDDD